MQQTEQQQNGARRVIPCYDELITFLKSWFAKSAPVFQKPILEVNRYSGNSAQWQKVVTWVVDPTAEGKLKEISLVCDNYTPLYIRVDIGSFRRDFQVQTALTIPYGDLKLMPGIPVIVSCHSDGATAIIFDASIVGIEEL
ncbi:hypothetical protein ES705_15970 [subsurface metagenome]